jgi:hypothetical protein
MASKEAQKIYDRLKARIGEELMVRNNHTVERYDNLLTQIQQQGTFTKAEAADIIIRYQDIQWDNLKE